MTGAAAQTQLKLIPQADLKSFDPVWNTAAITLNHAFMVYDTLFGLDAKMQPKPQMVESYTASADGLTHRFTLRAGMKYHDGTPVSAKDVPPSLTRWSKKTTDGAALVSRAASMKATGELTFEIVLKEPFGPIMVLDPTDQQIIHNISIMAAQTLKEIGMNVDLQATDWATVTTRRGQKAAPGQGSPGWNIFTTWSSSVIMPSPVTNFAMPTQCDGTNWFGWPCDEELERLRKAYIPLTDPAARKAAIEAIQKRYYEVMPFAITGQFQSPVAYRKNITGMPKTLVVTHWNTEKK